MKYMPPETLRRKWHQRMGNSAKASLVPAVSLDQFTKVDVYPFGLILWEICTQNEVFDEYYDIDPFCKSICDGDMRPKTDEIPLVLKDIMTNCWSKEPNQRPHYKDIVPQLENARIRYYLDYPSEVAFWQKYFPNLAEVPFDEFVKTLYEHYAHISKCTTRICDFTSLLNSLIGVPPKPNSVVTLSSYSQLITWFGPLFSDNNFLEFCNIMKSNWFHPEIKSGTTAESKLNSGPGTFLVRLTPEDNKDIHRIPFTIDFMDEFKKIQHYRIQRKKKNYHLLYNEFDYNCSSLPELIQMLTRVDPLVFKESVFATKITLYKGQSPINNSLV